jgi:hypothetical protein
MQHVDNQGIFWVFLGIFMGTKGSNMKEPVEREPYQTAAPAVDHRQLYGPLSGHSPLSGRQRPDFQDPDHPALTSKRLFVCALQLAGGHCRTKQGGLLSGP